MGVQRTNFINFKGIFDFLFLLWTRTSGLHYVGTYYYLTFYRNGQIYMDLSFTNKAMQAMTGFAIQLNKNSFGVTPASPLHMPVPLTPGQTQQVSLHLTTIGVVQKMEPLNNLQVCYPFPSSSSFPTR